MRKNLGPTFANPTEDEMLGMMRVWLKEDAPAYVRTYDARADGYRAPVD
jgi:hypothetical protein